MKKKTQELTEDWLAQEVRRINDDQPIVAERFYVVEVTPSRRESDEYSNYWTDVVVTKVSGYADSEEELQDFLDQHEPDEGNHFAIKKQNKRRFERWVDY